MFKPTDQLRYPDHYPPTNKWKKFFIGVRWLGPDLSFFKSLKLQQAGRVAEDMNIWGGGLRQNIAETMAYVFKKRLRWKSNVFLPQDKFNVICNGPRFDMFDDFMVEESIEEVEDQFSIKIPNSFWGGLEDADFGEVVDKIAAIKNA